ncbi:ABC transporter substrate-binding protein [Mycetocola sp.]|uniref:ABC transporter substrate-binding protein n=1 Tax=Mycetocola sp. TaxID=1871042 RepID=UPI0039899E0B
MKHRNRKILTAILAAGTIASLAACSSNLSSDAAGGAAETEKGPITIGVLVDQTAYLKTVDTGVLDGIDAAVKTINESGGVLGGRLIETVVADTSADPQTQVQAFQKLQTQNEPVMFITGFSSAGNAAVAPLAASSETPLVVSSVVPADDPEWVFSTITPARYETGIRVDYLKEQGITSVGILHDPTPYNKALLDTLTAQLGEANITVVGAEEHASDAVDLGAQTQKLLSSNPGGIIKLSAGPTQIIAAKALADAGSEIPLLIGIESRANIVQADAAYPHLLLAAAPLQVADELEKAEISDSITKFLEFNPGLEDPTYVGRGWDAMHIAIQAIETAGSTSGTEIRDALISMDPYDGTSGNYDYTDDDHYGITTNPDYLAEVTEDSTKIVYRPEER